MKLVRFLLNELVNAVFAILVAILIFIGIRQYILQPFQVDGSSMEPTLHNGDQMILMKHQTIDRFDVVVFPDPVGSNNAYIKRVIGMPGDSLYVKDNQLYINDVAYQEPYLLESPNQLGEPIQTADFSLWDTLGIEYIPEGYYFVMGDNRQHSGDSRQFGLVAHNEIMGVANLTYFPFDRMGTIEQFELTEHTIMLEER